MIIFLDANVVIYQVEGASPFRDKVSSLVSDIVAENPGASFAVSRLSVLECLVKPVRERNQPMTDRYRSFFETTDLTIVELSSAVIERALLLRAHSALRTPDAIQAASALTLPSAFIFVTGDSGLSKVAELAARIVT